MAISLRIPPKRCETSSVPVLSVMACPLWVTVTPLVSGADLKREWTAEQASRNPSHPPTECTENSDPSWPHPMFTTRRKLSICLSPPLNSTKRLKVSVELEHSQALWTKHFDSSSFSLIVSLVLSVSWIFSTAALFHPSQSCHCGAIMAWGGFMNVCRRVRPQWAALTAHKHWRMTHTSEPTSCSQIIIYSVHRLQKHVSICGFICT